MFFANCSSSSLVIGGNSGSPFSPILGPVAIFGCDGAVDEDDNPDEDGPDENSAFIPNPPESSFENRELFPCSSGALFSIPSRNSVSANPVSGSADPVAKGEILACVSLGTFVPHPAFTVEVSSRSEANKATVASSRSSPLKAGGGVCFSGVGTDVSVFPSAEMFPERLDTSLGSSSKNPLAGAVAFGCGVGNGGGVTASGAGCGTSSGVGNPHFESVGASLANS